MFAPSQEENTNPNETRFCISLRCLTSVYANDHPQAPASSAAMTKAGRKETGSFRAESAAIRTG
jgi:hypothetical protein